MVVIKCHVFAPCALLRTKLSEANAAALRKLDNQSIKIHYQNQKGGKGKQRSNAYVAL